MAKITLTKQQQQMLIAGVLCLGALGYVYIAFFWLPISHSIDSAQVKITEIEGKIEKANREAARLSRLEADLAALNEQAAQAERRLPQKKATPDILVTASELAEKYGVTLLSFTPGTLKSQQFFNELSYPLAIRGTFHNTGRFLAALALEERIFNVQNILYGEANADTGEMQVTFTLLSYQYKG